MVKFDTLYLLGNNRFFFPKQLDICVDYSLYVRTPFLELCLVAGWCAPPPSVGRPELLLGEPTTRIAGHMIRARVLLDNPNTNDFQQQLSYSWRQHNNTRSRAEIQDRKLLFSSWAILYPVLSRGFLRIFCLKPISHEKNFTADLTGAEGRGCARRAEPDVQLRDVQLQRTVRL